MNNNELNKIMKQAQSKTGLDISKMKEASEQGRLDDYVSKNLSNDKAKEIKNVLSNKDACEKLLSSPQAKELMKKLMEGK